MIEDLPILGICGRSDSGKTTLIEQAASVLRDKGLAVAVVKHAAGGFQADRVGSDSDRIFQAGADVLVQGPDGQFLRTHEGQGRSACEQAGSAPLQVLAGRYDLVLVEGYKTSPLPKVWLSQGGEAAPPEDVPNVIAALPPGPDRQETFLRLLADWLAGEWRKTPVFGCVLIGGSSRRMGRPKHLIRTGGQSWMRRTLQRVGEVCQDVVVVGTGEMPADAADCTRLVDAPAAAGPMAGILAAMRWAPRASWLVVACDLPRLSHPALDWLLSTRAPGVWATLPRLAGAQTVEPLLAHYDFRCRGPLEQMAAAGNFRLNDLAEHEKVVSPAPPAAVAEAWWNVNTEADLAGLDTDQDA